MLVGHHVACDLRALHKEPDFELNFNDPSSLGLPLAHNFDTYVYARTTSELGAKVPGAGLVGLANWPGRGSGVRVDGFHNAGTDVTYTLRVLLMFAVDWEGVGVSCGGDGTGRELG